MSKQWSMDDIGKYIAKKERKYGKRKLPIGLKSLSKKHALAYVKSEKDKKQDKAIGLIRKKLNDGTAHYTHHYRYTGSTGSDIAKANYFQLSANDNLKIETALSTIQYYNPTAPTNLTTVDGTIGAYSKSYRFNYVKQKFTVRNNYVVPCKTTVYIVVPKSDNSRSPYTCLQDGLNDIGSPPITFPLIKLTDSPVFSKLWKIVKTKTKVLQAGQEFTVHYKTKSFVYDPSYQDSHSSSYQPKCKSFLTVIRTEGVLGHDTTTAEYAQLNADVDFEQLITWDFNYDAGADIRQIKVVDVGATAFTVGGITSNKPIADNQAWSST